MTGAKIQIISKNLNDMMYDLDALRPLSKPVKMVRGLFSMSGTLSDNIKNRRTQTQLCIFRQCQSILEGA